MGILDFIFGVNNPNSALNAIDNDLNDLVKLSNECTSENISDLMDYMDFQMLSDRIISNDMPIYLALFYEVIKCQGNINEPQKKFLHEFISKYPFDYFPNNQMDENCIRVYSYEDAFNYDNSLKADLYSVGFPSLKSYVWIKNITDVTQAHCVDTFIQNFRYPINLFYNLDVIGHKNDFPLVDQYLSLISVISDCVLNIYNLSDTLNETYL